MKSDFARKRKADEELVVYWQDYDERGLWVRPKEMFLETVALEGQQVARFDYIGPEDE